MLPNPSSLSLIGTPDDKIQYVVNYLNRLVRELDKTIGRNGQTAKEEQRAVKDISYNEGKLIVVYTDGAVKYITIGE